MSLQVWLPLNGSAENQGLCGPLTISGITFADGGKIGGKYLSAGTITVPAATAGTFFNKNNMSFAFWLCPIGTSPSGIIMGQNAMSPGNNRMYSIFQYPTPNDLHLSWQDETSSSTWTSGRWEGFFPADTWTHCCITYNGSTVSIYQNGILYNTWNATSNRSLFNYDFPIYGSAIRKLNDVRIYDHCLSAKEVKELSKGLVLHYKLDGKDETTTNLQSNGRMSTGSCYNGATGKYGFGTNTDIYYEDGNFQGRDCVKFKMGTAGLAAHPFINIAYSPAVNNYKTISFDYYPTILDKLVFYSYKGESPCTWSYNVDGIKASSSTATTSITVPVKTNKWNHVELTLYNTGTVADGWNYFQIGSGNHTSTTTDYWLFSNVQIEVKDHATPFTLGTRTYTTEYDCSGYGNNGTISGTLTGSSDSSRYNASIVFNGSSKITSSSAASLYGGNTATLTAWVNQTARNSSGDRACIIIGGYYLTISTAGYLSGYAYGKSPAGYHTGSKLISLNTWTHLAIVWDGSYIKGYINGVQDFSVTCTGTFANNQTVQIGLEGSSRDFRGKMSDVRIYATALSADDVKELYQTAASIDNKGNVYAYELEEV